MLVRLNLYVLIDRHPLLSSSALFPQQLLVSLSLSLTLSLFMIVHISCYSFVSGTAHYNVTDFIWAYDSPGWVCACLFA